jgi:hypothetical protein
MRFEGRGAEPCRFPCTTRSSETTRQTPATDEARARAPTARFVRNRQSRARDSTIWSRRSPTRPTRQSLLAGVEQALPGSRRSSLGNASASSRRPNSLSLVVQLDSEPGLRPGGERRLASSKRSSLDVHSCSPLWLLRKVAVRLVEVISVRRGRFRGSARGRLRPPSQAGIGAVVCRQSLSRLCVAAISRHSDRAAALPRRWKRSQRRLNLVSAKTGSIMPWRLA